MATANRGTFYRCRDAVGGRSLTGTLTVQGAMAPRRLWSIFPANGSCRRSADLPEQHFRSIWNSQGWGHRNANLIDIETPEIGPDNFRDFRVRAAFGVHGITMRRTITAGQRWSRQVLLFNRLLLQRRADTSHHEQRPANPTMTVT